MINILLLKLPKIFSEIPCQDREKWQCLCSRPGNHFKYNYIFT